MNRRVAMVVLVTSACGHLHFDDARDAGVGDAVGDADAGDAAGPARCMPTARPDTSQPDVRLGLGTPASCGVTALQSALDQGGTIVANCGDAPVTFNVTSELVITRDVVLDGRGLLTLRGGTTRLFRVTAPGAQVAFVDLTMTAGRASADGGAILVEGGDLRVFGVTFTSNTAIGEGGAIAMVPTAGSLEIVSSTFDNNSAGSGGAVWAADALSIQESTFHANQALGGGGLGGAIAHEGTGDLAVCGSTFEANRATSMGGALHRVCTDGGCTDTLDRTSITNNTAMDAGGAFVQDSRLAVRQVSITTNSATTGQVGGLWDVGAGSFIGEQLSVVGNSALSGLGAGMNIGAPGTLSFATIARNTCTNPACDSSGLQATAGLAVRASLIVDNALSLGGATCRISASDGSGTFQWPAEPSAPCGTSVQFTDPQLGATSTRGGPRGTFVVAPPAAASPARAVVTDCPAEDQVGDPRPVPCTAGAVEP